MIDCVVDVEIVIPEKFWCASCIYRCEEYGNEHQSPEKLKMFHGVGQNDKTKISPLLFSSVFFVFSGPNNCLILHSIPVLNTQKQIHLFTQERLIYLCRGVLVVRVLKWPLSCLINYHWCAYQYLPFSLFYIAFYSPFPLKQLEMLLVQ